jgi:hypothetical protein
VEIEFATTKLADAAHSLEAASRLFGRPIGRKYIQRLGILRSVANIDELYALRPLRLYPLIERMYQQRHGMLRVMDNLGDLSGIRALREHRPWGNRYDQYTQYAINVAGSSRLIFERIEAEKVRVLGVEDHHGN